MNGSKDWEYIAFANYIEAVIDARFCNMVENLENPTIVELDQVTYVRFDKGVRLRMFINNQKAGPLGRIVNIRTQNCPEGLTLHVINQDKRHLRVLA